MRNLWLNYPECKPEAPGRYEVFSKDRNKKFFSNWTGNNWEEYEKLITQFLIPMDSELEPGKSK
jgi:hypothetical protein